jgi:hypothetical protein
MYHHLLHTRRRLTSVELLSKITPPSRSTTNIDPEGLGRSNYIWLSGHVLTQIFQADLDKARGRLFKLLYFLLVIFVLEPLKF